MAVAEKMRQKVQENIRDMKASEGLTIHTGYAEHAAKENNLEAAKNQLLAIVPHLETARTYGGEMADLAQDLERAIESYKEAINQKTMTKGKDLLIQLKKYFIPKKIKLTALLQLKEKQKKAA